MQLGHTVYYEIHARTEYGYEEIEMPTLQKAIDKIKNDATYYITKPKIYRIEKKVSEIDLDKE
jgi:hypothetical protein